MKVFNKRILWLVLGFFYFTISSYAQEIFQPLLTGSKTPTIQNTRTSTTPSAYRLYTVNTQLLKTSLSTAKQRVLQEKSELIVKLPTPLGIQRFAIQEATILSEALAKKFPSIKSYVGIGLDDKTAVVRFSNSSDGFHAMINSANYPVYFIDPYTKDKNIVIAYLKKDTKTKALQCFIKDNQLKVQKKQQQLTAQSDGKLHTYRLALAATGEYSQFHLQQQNISPSATDTQKKEAVLAAMNTTMTRVNGIFERDLGVTMVLVANEADIIYLDGATDPFDNNDGDALVNQSQTICDTKIGNANYDIGHTFSTGAGGLAGLAVVCETGYKGQGVTGSPSPMGDAYDVDYVAHEMGHQFGANHTQNNDCQRNNATAIEPGSGSTIMGYAGICSPNVQNSGDAYFHAVSIAEMSNLVSATANKVVVTDVGNAVPTAAAGNDYTIPKSTPFVLVGTATDANTTDALSYTWEEIDNEIGYTMPPKATNAGGPLFRSLSPTSSPLRYFPAISTVLLGDTSTTWEVLPSVSRNLDFAFTVRDNINATARDDIKLTVDGASGPFYVTSMQVVDTLEGNSTQTITWNVAKTNLLPVDCQSVSILLSVDGGLTYNTVLEANTPNDGSQQIILPNISTNQARIMVKASENVFYALNAVTFSINQVANVDSNPLANFSMYPNPSKGEIRLSFEVESAAKVIVKLFDLRGRLLMNNEYTTTGTIFSKIIDFDNLHSGLYILSIKNGEKQAVKKLIIE